MIEKSLLASNATLDTPLDSLMSVGCASFGQLVRHCCSVEEVAALATQLEYQIFSDSRLVMSYRAAVMRKVNCVSLVFRLFVSFSTVLQYMLVHWMFPDDPQSILLFCLSVCMSACYLPVHVCLCTHLNICVPGWLNSMSFAHK